MLATLTCEQESSTAVDAGKQTSRILYLDALRNTLMALGVVIHSAQLFRAYTPAQVELHPSHPFFDYLCSGIHAFRLPAFFLIAGYVGTFVIRERGLSFYLQRRLLRIGLPFVAALLTLNVLDAVMAAGVTGMFSDGWTVGEIAACVRGAFAAGNLRHLWFLPVLLIYSAVLASLLWLLRKVSISWRTEALVEMFGKSDAYLILLPAWIVVTGLAGWKLAPVWERFRWLQIPELDQLIQFAPFFFFGVMAQRIPSVWRRFGSTPKWYGMTCGGMAITLVISLLPFPRLASYALLYFQSLAGWALVGVVILFGRLVLDRRIPLLTESPDLAYSVYLFHHVFVTALAFLFVGYELSSFVLFALITAVAGALSIATHQVITRVSVFRVVFNGRLLPHGATLPVTGRILG